MLKELTSILLKLFYKIEREAVLPKSFYEAGITLIPKLEKDIRKLYSNFLGENRCKISQ
jgi:hypothetical protein